MPFVQCSGCKQPCYKKPSVIAKSISGEIYCGNECRSASRTKWAPCLVCAKPVRAGLKRTTCSKSCSTINRRKIDREQIGVPKKKQVSSNYEIRQRLIEYKGAERCECCGYERIPAVVQVHHIIERSKGGSDEMENLEFLCPTCHMEEHWKRRNGAVAEPGLTRSP
jgi:5-methylcytosine-specific restriction endonuclease McrA